MMLVNHVFDALWRKLTERDVDTTHEILSLDFFRKECLQDQPWQHLGSIHEIETLF